MAYQIYNTDGTLFATINDGTLNTSSSMTLVGKNWAGYGAYLDTNFLHLMQNFSNSSAPSAPVTGQLYWNNASNTLSIYNGSTWKPFAASTASSTAPSSGNVIGDLWYNTTAQTLNVYNGTTWLAVGPSVTNGTGAQTTVITDNVSANHSVIEFLVGTNVVGIISQDAFTPGTPIPGFSNVQPGLNLSSNIGGGGTAASTVTSSLTALNNVNVGGNVSATGNITGTYLIGNGAFITGQIGNGASNVSANTGSFTGNVVAGNISTVGSIVAGNIVLGNISANGSYGSNGQILTSQGPGLPAVWTTSAASYGNTQVAAFLPTYTGNLVALTGAITTTSNVTANKGTFTSIVEGATTATYGATTTINLASADYFSVTCVFATSSTTTFAFTNAATSGLTSSFILTMLNGGSVTVNWPVSVKWAGGIAPTLTSSATNPDIIAFFTVDNGTTWYGEKLGVNYS